MRIWRSGGVVAVAPRGRPLQRALRPRHAEPIPLTTRSDHPNSAATPVQNSSARGRLYAGVRIVPSTQATERPMIVEGRTITTIEEMLEFSSWRPSRQPESKPADISPAHCTGHARLPRRPCVTVARSRRVGVVGGLNAALPSSHVPAVGRHGAEPTPIRQDLPSHDRAGPATKKPRPKRGYGFCLTSGGPARKSRGFGLYTLRPPWRVGGGRARLCRAPRSARNSAPAMGPGTEEDDGMPPSMLSEA